VEVLEAAMGKEKAGWCGSMENHVSQVESDKQRVNFFSVEAKRSCRLSIIPYFSLENIEYFGNSIRYC
jgi:hypothetical protein